MQEQSSARKEQAKQATEEQIQSQKRQTERERAEIERETIRVKKMAEAEAKVHEAKLTEDHNRRMLIDRIQGERDKWLAAIHATFSHIEGMTTDNNSFAESLFGFIYEVHMMCIDWFVFINVLNICMDKFLCSFIV
jgi:ATPase family AAA domain-containing protein 3A/B